MKPHNPVVALFLLLLVASPGLAQTPAQNLRVPGLKAAVTVRRDACGIPHITAKSEDDLMLAQGYVTAQDRLWQMDLFRRVVRGELSEIFGKAVLDEDKQWRTLGFARSAGENRLYLAPETRRAVESYARGVNAYMATLDEKTLPLEFRILQYRPAAWKPEDSVAIGGILMRALGESWHLDLLKASLQDLPHEKYDLMFAPESRDDVLLVGKDAATAREGKEGDAFPDASPAGVAALDAVAAAQETRRRSLERLGLYAEHLSASNAWVVAGSRTASGKPILANDPHLQNAQPPVWHMVHLAAPGTHVAGVALPGLPGILIGHNENIAWGVTNGGSDVQDLYRETFNERNEYRTPQGWTAAQVRAETIKVRKDPLSPETEEVRLEVVTTRNGPIVAESGGSRYALKWTAADPRQSSIEAFYRLCRARDWASFTDALKRYDGTSQNFMYADTRGNIGWYAAGKVPLRRTGDGSLPYDGTTEAGDWVGYIPFERLPHLYNPAEGFIVTANQRTVGTSYPYHGAFARVFVPARARRIYDLLATNPKMDLDASHEIQRDTFSILNARFARAVVRLNAASDATLALFRDWDGRMTPDSRAALLAEEIRVAFRNRVLAGALRTERAKRVHWPGDGSFQDRLLATQPKEWLPEGGATYADLFRTCDSDARAKLTKNLGSDTAMWTWGEAGKIRLPHPLAEAPLIGLTFAVRALPQKGSAGAAATPNVGAAVSMRLLADLSDWDRTRQGLPTGESGNPLSPHWADQLDSWYAGPTPVFPFTAAAVEKATTAVVELTPP